MYAIWIYSNISIHAPRVGSDLINFLQFVHAINFNPRSPCGERHIISLHNWIYINFNPRSPCGERRGFCEIVIDAFDFNPRSPCGERRYRFYHNKDCGLFQSTLPVWGATNTVSGTGFIIRISIHAPRVGSDIISCWSASGVKDFNPRSPCGERRSIPKAKLLDILISIHAPRVGSDSKNK